MKAAFITVAPSSDKLAWSGINESIRSALKSAGWSLSMIDSLQIPLQPLFRMKNLLQRPLSQRSLTTRHPRVLRSFASQVSRRIKNLDIDLVFSPGTIPIACLKTDLPVIFWTDAVFASMIDYYPGFTSLSKESIRHGNAMEQEALRRSSLALYTNDWAARAALEHYRVPSEKIHVVPLGANLDPDIQPGEMDTVLRQRRSDVIRLLFLGRDWDRKGGSIAVAVADILRERGSPVELHIIGCEPEVPESPHIFVHGFLNRFISSDFNVLDSLFRSTHFLILPTQAECAAMALAETCAYGVPALTTNVGGNETIIQDGFNGFLFSPKALPESYADRIQDTLSSWDRYTELAQSAHLVQRTRFNWTAAVQEIDRLIRQKL